jgi:hypothetical protein
MGQVKKYAMQQEENDEFYQWLEDNLYGDLEEDSDEWLEAVDEYNCENNEMENLDREMFERNQYEYYLYLTLTKANDIFIKDISELKKMLSNIPEAYANSTFYKMVYAHTITIFEVYLEDTVKSLIMTNDTFLRNAINNVEPFKKKAIMLKNISLEPDGIKNYVLNQLSENLFHNVSKVAIILDGVIGQRLDLDISDAAKIVSVRHDVVHRNGKDKEGKTIEIDKSKVECDLAIIERFVETLQIKLLVYV